MFWIVVVVAILVGFFPYLAIGRIRLARRLKAWPSLMLTGVFIPPLVSWLFVPVFYVFQKAYGPPETWAHSGIESHEDDIKKTHAKMMWGIFLFWLAVALGIQLRWFVGVVLFVVAVPVFVSGAKTEQDIYEKRDAC